MLFHQELKFTSYISEVSIISTTLHSSKEENLLKIHTGQKKL